MSDEIQRYAVNICDDCMDLKGHVCRNPACTFCRLSMKEVKQVLRKTNLRIEFESGEIYKHPAEDKCVYVLMSHDSSSYSACVQGVASSTEIAQAWVKKHRDAAYCGQYDDIWFEEHEIDEHLHWEKESESTTSQS